ncbi:formimidoylglutamate deiminase [Ornithinimicrobium tianjinense]|uniref:Formimidoylglutamate deiminase n=1 Tax=Ornithinimicrobium tianjinense TaxID=1195761 RepID=A0A917BTF4_9MICO|nr:formimidoylglutamate deiminase [Ornithinimicrobium tianjinense]GGF58098.1 formimidoylglutamate deiminase [Ornithinimicrobium tianjinense]
MSSTTFHAAYAHLPTGVERDVRLTVDRGRFTAVETGAAAQPGDRELPGVVLPGLANAHSHVFHRALRGRTHVGGGTFWTWREGMYAVAAQLDPTSYLALARAAYAEMALAAITAVGEFHYLHHGPGGARYLDPNEMGHALVEAAADAGIRLTLLDTCYLAGGLGPDGHVPLEGPQLRFGDGDAQTWALRVDDLRDHTDGGPAHVRVGAAIHSVRAVPREALGVVASWARQGGRPLHIHLSEQPAENEACLAAHGLTPTGLLAAEGVLGPDLSAVHATHLTDEDVALLGQHSCWACFCPTTERDLADGIGPAVSLRDAGARLSLGSDQHAVVDLIEEARALEMHERLDTLQRGRFAPEDLLAAATAHESIGWPDAGRLELGARADLVAVRLDSVRTAGSDPAQVLLSATASDVDTVVVDGAVVVEGGQHRLGDVGRLLHDAITPLWKDA